MKSNEVKTRDDYEKVYLLNDDGKTGEWVSTSELEPTERVEYEKVPNYHLKYLNNEGKFEDKYVTAYKRVYIQNNTDIDTAEGETDSKVNNNALDSLTGTLRYIATPKTIKIKVGDTITLQGLGKNFSGDYYVKEVSRNISKEGYSHTCKVSKADFLDNLTSAGGGSEAETSVVKNGGLPYDEKGYLQTIYTVSAGDTPYTVSKKYFGDGNMYYRLFDYTTGTRLDVTSQLVVGQQILVK